MCGGNKLSLGYSAKVHCSSTEETDQKKVYAQRETFVLSKGSMEERITVDKVIWATENLQGMRRFWHRQKTFRDEFCQNEENKIGA